MALALCGGAPPVESKPAAKTGKPHAVSARPESVAQQGIPLNGLPSLAAEGAIVLDALTGETLYEKNPHEQLYPASTTKILTALLVIEEGDLDRVVVIEPRDTQVEPCAIGFKPGDRFTRRELLYAMMLKSANDVAQALARDNAGSVEAFAEKMTRRAASLGALGSHFANPHGLPNPDHYTTPYDLALIARAAMQQPTFRQIVGTVSYAWTTQQGATVLLKNHNKLLWCPPWKFEGCTGLKTGYTNKAQGVLVSSALRNQREVISVVMRADKEGKWVDSKALLSYGLSHLPENPRFD
ncbi:MAG: D-alanyl-D-alanine carboxypeptidase [Verrucomicrobia bacterium]|nr:D-alanyl-D-alanine carboxypeptidase [Verrucomicrobiota bacterium]